MLIRPFLPVAILLLAPLPNAGADEKLKGMACRSVHLGYRGEGPGGHGLAFYNEVTIDNSAAGTYFAVCGWNKGYFGLQDLGNGKKVLIFSVWDSRQNDAKAVGEEQRVKVIHKDDKVRVGRFGDEGTGGQSFFDYDWKIGATYRFMVAAKIAEPRTEYSGYFFVPEDKVWKHLITFSTITGGKPMSGFYSFVEDFKRDRVSATRARKAHFGNAWLRDVDGKWAALGEARFTADANPATNIDAGVDGSRFFLATGGETENTNARLNSRLQLPDAKKATPPADPPDKAKP